uniref:transposase domain-containing protein n=1 Tax=Salmonella sp. s54836 TaxID=3159673 RepID=UPI0039800C3B
FRDVVERYGIPHHAWLDNGRGFASKLLTGGVANRYRFKVREEDPTGILVALGVQIHWATPYHGQAKPIERAFRDLCDRVAKHPAFAGAYTGHRVD